MTLSERRVVFWGCTNYEAYVGEPLPAWDGVPRLNAWLDPGGRSRLRRPLVPATPYPCLLARALRVARLRQSAPAKSRLIVLHRFAGLWLRSNGVLHSAEPGNDYCNGNIAVIQSANDMACMVDCLHVDDVAAILAEKELDKRLEGK